MADPNRNLSRDGIRNKPLFSMVGPVYGEDMPVLKTSEEDERGFRLPMVIPTSELASHPSIPEVRQFVWNNPLIPPSLNAPKMVYLIDTLGDLFDDALKELENSTELGIKLEGNGIHRFGNLCTIALSTRDTVFIFDVAQLQTRCFKYGLRYILESLDIVKVCHDVRGTSDILKNKYDVILSNVFDTSVADMTFYKSLNEDGLIPKYLRSYQTLCIEYLGVPPASLFYNPVRSNNIENDSAMFWEDPITNKMILALARNCMYLLPLKNICEKAMVVHFNRATQLFVDKLRFCENYEAEVQIEAMSRKPEKIPKDMQKIYKSSPKERKKEKKAKDKRIEGKFIHQDVGEYLPHAICRL